MKKEISLKVLSDMRGYLDKGWHQGCFARDKDNNPVQPHDEKAVSFCIIGALIKARGTDTAKWGGTPELWKATIEKNPKGMSVFNDAPETKKEDVIAVLDRAIELLNESEV